MKIEDIERMAINNHPLNGTAYDLIEVTKIFSNLPKIFSIVRAAKEVCKDHDLLCEDSNNTLCKLSDALLDFEEEE